MACLHIFALERLAYRQALYLCHSLQAHVLCDGVHHSLAHHPTLRQLLELRDWTMFYSFLYLGI